jgi:hypothetical protein
VRLSREIDKRARIAFFVDYVFAITTISLMPKNEVRVRVRVRDHDHLLHTPKNQAGTALEQPHEPSLWHYAPTLYAPILQLLYPACNPICASGGSRGAQLLRLHQRLRDHARHHHLVARAARAVAPRPPLYATQGSNHVPHIYIKASSFGCHTQGSNSGTYLPGSRLVDSRVRALPWADDPLTVFHDTTEDMDTNEVATLYGILDKNGDEQVTR